MCQGHFSIQTGQQLPAATNKEKLFDVFKETFSCRDTNVCRLASLFRCDVPQHVVMLYSGNDFYQLFIFLYLSIQTQEKLRAASVCFFKGVGLCAFLMP